MNISRLCSPRRILLLAGFLGLSVLGLAPVALADTQISSNWSGYSAHRSGVHFRSIGARWRVPTLSCSSPGFSAMWVGLGGYSANSSALEQTGTEADCSTAGRATYFAWYELVPAASRRISLTVRPGNLMSATVKVVGHRVTLTLTNLTTRRTFSRTLTASVVDTSSAEWILESPSECNSSQHCVTLPLAAFSGARFGSARAVSLSGRSGSITSGPWGTTKIELSSSGVRFIGDGGPGSGGGNASPSSLAAGGSAFSVNYQPSAQAPGRFMAPRSVRLSGRTHLVHPGRVS